MHNSDREGTLNISSLSWLAGPYQGEVHPVLVGVEATLEGDDPPPREGSKDEVPFVASHSRLHKAGDPLVGKDDGVLNGISNWTQA